jgi:hypothetical protein
METQTSSFLLLLHSVLRYGVLLTVALSALVSLRGWFMRRPVFKGERLSAVAAMAICHTQLLVGLVLYAQRHAAFGAMAQPHQRFWKYEHLGAMLMAIVLVTLGRVFSKRATTDRRRQFYIWTFFLVALALMLWATPWPSTTLGQGRGWL